MQTDNQIQMAGDFDRIFALASDISHWPDFLPHYRWVKILERVEGRVIAEMAARHKGLPLWWKTIQTPLPRERRIHFTHIDGITTGMEVDWTFEEMFPEGACPVWRVQIHHDFTLSWPLVGPWVANRVIGQLFVHQVANKTLTTMKKLVEQSAT